MYCNLWELGRCHAHELIQIAATREVQECQTWKHAKIDANKQQRVGVGEGGLPKCSFPRRGEGLRVRTSWH